jgi:hypothetical protein
MRFNFLYRIKSLLQNSWSQLALQVYARRRRIISPLEGGQGGCFTRVNAWSQFLNTHPTPSRGEIVFLWLPSGVLQEPLEGGRP